MNRCAARSLHMKSKAILLAFAIALCTQVNSYAQSSHLRAIPTACGPSASSSFVNVDRTSQILLVVDALGSNAAAEIGGINGHPITSLSFDTTAVFGLLGADPNLQVV